MRQCGGCTLCCKLTPVAEIKKPANTRCQHQRAGKGCAIYARRPRSCQAWNCQWLGNAGGTENMSRPDRSHYVIDILPDFITQIDNETGERQDIMAVQVWVDPKYPDAHRDPELRAFLLKEGEAGRVGLIRYDERKGFVLFPPNMVADGQWHEQGTETSFVREKSLMQMLEDGEIEGNLKMHYADGRTEGM
jgi:hypothetical protein